ncbi:MAG TPA: DUF3291 domain-containing protein [Candidatus Acidoferrum sp.]|nr:DUF3291 domain-containing protein [Candidatus Acidoferrum sp.]
MNDLAIAQLNVGRAHAPMESPIMAGFVDRLDEINALAEASPGFIWRLKDEAGNATAIRAFDDPRVIVNLSMWVSIEELFDFAYRTTHVELFRGRRSWFEPYGSPHLVLWWHPANEPPTIEEAKRRLALLTVHGPTPAAFTFKARFAPQQVLAPERPTEPV